MLYGIDDGHFFCAMC